MRKIVDRNHAEAFGQDFLRFLEPGADRLVRLMGMLSLRGLSGKILSIAGRRHILVKRGGKGPRVLMVAHYDRVAGSPGALDNSAACLVLANVAKEILAGEKAFDQGVFFLFTDGEEAPATEGPLAQGAYPLGHGLRRVLGDTIPAIIVLDVVGRGTRLVLSSAPKDMLERIGEGEGRVVGLLRDLEIGLHAAARAANFSAPLLLPLPWSDDLGFVLAGLPAMEVSLLPGEEAERYRQGIRGSGSDGAGARVDSLPTERALGDAWPETWSLLHGPGDSADLLEASAIEAMTKFCLTYCRLYSS